MDIERFSKKIFEFVFAFLVFASVSIIVSYWVGFFSLSTPLILVASLPITYWLWKKFPVKPEKIPVSALLAALLVAGLCAFPLLIVHPFYMGSNDVLHTTTLRTLSIQGNIPETYSPYSDISFTYQIGFHLLAKVFADLFFFVEDYQVMWFLGVLFAALEVILVYLVSKELFKSEKAGKWAAILFIGTKTVYINMYFGMFPRMLAACLILSFLYLYLKKNKLVYIMLPALIMVHPGMLLNFAVLMMIFVVFNRQQFAGLAKTIPFCLLAIPAFVQNYSTYISRMLFGRITGAVGMERQSFDFIGYSIGFVLGMGWGPAALFGLSIVYTLIKKNLSKQKLFALSIFFAGSFLYYFTEFFNFTVSNVFPWLFTLGGVFFVALTLSEIKIPEKQLKYVKALVVVLLLMGFVSSGYLMDRIPGSKISREEAEFAFKFRELDPELKTTLFLGVSSSKTAELSNKIPFNTNAGWFLPIDERLSVHNEAYARESEKKEIHAELMESKCIECVHDLNVDYVAINTEEFPELPETPILESGKIKLYKLK